LKSIKNKLKLVKNKLKLIKNKLTSLINWPKNGCGGGQKRVRIIKYYQII
jgi:hypothetical protein